jgi:putative transposase
MSKHDISQWRACRLVSVDPKTVRREREPDCPGIRQRMRAIAAERRRFGWRRVGLMLKQEGIVMIHRKLRRLYREEGLAVRRRCGPSGRREHGGGLIRRRLNEHWSLDFVPDVFGEARRFRVLGVIDDGARECIGILADTLLPRTRVARELDAIIRLYGKPKTIVS